MLPDRKIRHVGRDQTNPTNKSLTGISDARSDVIRTGVLIFRVPRCRVLSKNYDINMNQIIQPVISRRQKTARPDHHLWNNHGIWWFHGTLHLPDYTSRRIRCNLGTSDVQTARQIRDRILSANHLQFP